MKHHFHRAASYLNHVIKCKHRKGHRIHSPFVFEFVNGVVFDKTNYPEYVFFTNVRNELKKTEEVLPVEPFGAGSQTLNSPSQKIKNILNKTSVSHKNGKLLFRMTKHYKPSVIIELGTSIGMSTLYLAKGAPNAQIFTIEGNPHRCNFARSLLKKHQAVHVKAIHGMFDDYLSYFSENYQHPGMVFIDGNHTYEATLKYFNHFSKLVEEGFIVLHDIYWSPSMRKAWNEIQHSVSAPVTIDLFSMGIVILRRSITPGHYCIRF